MTGFFSYFVPCYIAVTIVFFLGEEMIKKYCLLLTMVILPAYSSEQSSTPSTLKRDYNLEKVKELRIQHCTFLNTEKNAKIKELKRKCSPETISKFNLNGELTAFVFSESPTALISSYLKEATLKMIYLYDSKDKLVKIETYKVYGKQPRRDEICKVSYKNNGKQRIEQCYGDNDMPSSRAITQFDNNGDPTVWMINFSANEKYREEKKFINHREVESVLYVNDKATRKAYGFYDEKNNLIKKKEIKYLSKEEVVETYQYQYNNRGDWVERVSYQLDKPVKVTQRKITYYE